MGFGLLFIGYFFTFVGALALPISAYTYVLGTGIILFSLKNCSKSLLNDITSEKVSDGWTRLSVTFTARADAKHTVRIYNDRMEGIVYADDLHIGEGVVIVVDDKHTIDIYDDMIIDIY